MENRHNFLSRDRIEISKEGTERVWTIVSFMHFSDPKVETVTRGTSYKFALLN